MPLGATTEYDRSSQPQQPLPFHTQVPQGALRTTRQCAAHSPDRDPKITPKLMHSAVGPLHTVQTEAWLVVHKPTYMNRDAGKPTPNTPNLTTPWAEARGHRKTCADRSRLHKAIERHSASISSSQRPNLQRRSTTLSLACRAANANRSRPSRSLREHSKLNSRTHSTHGLAARLPPKRHWSMRAYSPLHKEGSR
jgi:hypothetical protein